MRLRVLHVADERVHPGKQQTWKTVEVKPVVCAIATDVPIRDADKSSLEANQGGATQ
jgi:hypothetical protein